MKKATLLALATLAGSITAAYADVTIVITGATAFRSSAQQAIRDSFSPGVEYAYLNNAGGTLNVTSTNRGIFRGNFPGITGTTTVLTSWSGSVEGIQALQTSTAVQVLDPALTTISTGGTSITPAGASYTTLAADLAFSDVRAANTPAGGDGLNANPEVGVVAFVPIITEPPANNGATPDDNEIDPNFTNLTQQGLRTLVQNGVVRLSTLTGDLGGIEYPTEVGDYNKVVVWTGRSDASGTRTFYLAESKFGYQSLAQQYKALGSSNNTTEFRQWPAGDTGNISNLWNADGEGFSEGNGGWGSSSDLRTVMGWTTNGAKVTQMFEGTPIDIITGRQVYGITILTAADAKTAADAGGRALSFNGVSIAPASAALSEVDQRKIASGAYTLWSFQNLYYKSLEGDKVTFYERLTAPVGTNGNSIHAKVESTGNGVPLSKMGATNREDDGGKVNPPSPF
jgi:hypothetical protein